MLKYKFYHIARNGQIAGPGTIVELRNDDAALDHARSLTGRHGVEIWTGVRRVAYVPSDSRAPEPRPAPDTAPD